MKQIITINTFREAFKNYNRTDNFSYEGLEALFNYFEDLESDIGYEISLDVIAICCDYTEYNSIKEYNNDYEAVETIEEIENKTTVIKINDEAFIIQQY